MSSCVFPGSFDPVTRGHMDLISRAAGIFDRVTVTVMVNVHKKGTIPTEKRIELLKEACGELENVRVDRWDGLLADYMREKGERVIIRGVRGAGEYDSEMISSGINRMLNPEIETLLMPASEGKNGVSSSAVREIAAFGGDISAFVPEGMADKIGRLLGLE